MRYVANNGNGGRTIMKRTLSMLTGASVGAAVMYFFDPVAGNRRRALLRDQLIHLFHKAGDRGDARLRDLRNRAYGAVAEIRGAMRDSHTSISDDVLVDRVRSQIGRHTSHASALEVSAHDGVVRLRGPILADEVGCLLDAIGQIRGVADIEDQLEVHESPAGISALQGSGRS
jgi:hypothetical protein